MIGIVRRLSYARSLPGPAAGIAVRFLEWTSLSTPRLLWRLRHLARGTLPEGLALCDRALDAFGITVMAEGLDHVPRKGPVVVVANHPTGILDGAALIAALSRVRGDIRIMARALAADMPQIAPLVLSVPYGHALDRRHGLRHLNRAARAHLADGAVVVVFPAGRIAEDVEFKWSGFGLRLARETGATVLPVAILDRPSPLYRRSARLHPILRQGVLLQEALRRADRPFRLRIGAPLTAADHMASRARRIVLALRDL